MNCGVFEAFSGAEVCTTDNGPFSNRTLEVPSEDTTLDVTCWSACEACDSIETVDITFQVDLADEDVDPECSPSVAGNFNGFAVGSLPLTDSDGDGVWEVVASLPAGTDVEYKFVNCTTFEDIPSGSSCSVNTTGTFNRGLTVPESDAVLPEVCFGSCQSCSGFETSAVVFQLNGATLDIDASCPPAVAGSFNGFSTTDLVMLDDDDDGIWTATASLPVGESFEYKFVNCTSFEDIAAGAECAVDTTGFWNRALTVEGPAQVLDAVCFGSCLDCEEIGEVDVLFSVDMANQEVDTTCGVQLAGSFNGFSTSADPMTDEDGDGVWTATVTLTTGEPVEFKYVNCTSFEDVPFGADCTVNTGGFTNRGFTPAADSDLGVPCYGSCGPCEAP